jgi:hypothetical protein
LVEASVVQGEDIEQLMLSIKASRKPLPVWAIDMAMRAYAMWKTYKNGEKVDAVRLEVLAVLRTVAEVKEQAEAGRKLTEREYRLTRGLLDASGRRLDDLTSRIDDIQRIIEGLRTEVNAWKQRAQALERRFLRRGCGVGRAWRNGRCVEAVSGTPETANP